MLIHNCDFFCPYLYYYVSIIKTKKKQNIFIRLKTNKNKYYIVLMT